MPDRNRAQDELLNRVDAMFHPDREPPARRILVELGTRLIAVEARLAALEARSTDTE